MAYRPYETGEMSDDTPANELASPWVRLVAWLIDVAIYFVVTTVAAVIGVVIAGVGFSDFTDFGDEFFIGALVAVVVFTLLPLFVVFIVQMVLLATRGQTIGKIIKKIRVVDAVTGEHPGWARLIFLRTIVSWLISGALNVIPFVGQGLGGLYFLVDSLFIFRADHRTIHDLIAGTRVDKVAN